MEAPVANNRDIQSFLNSKTGGTKLGGKRVQRRRPPSWRRRQSKPWGSIWATDVAQASVEQRQRPVLREFPGVLGLKVPFSLLYKLQIQDAFAISGAFGPLWIFEPARVGLLLSYLAGRKPLLRLPGWRRTDLAYTLYQAAKL
eukprot:1421575-Heterocapsa_arctica.AAC.1